MPEKPVTSVADAMDYIATQYARGGEVLHQQGRHVQHAHGHRTTLANDASADAHQGGMIALMPAPEDAKRLALRGGEAADELHCTLFFLGGDVSGWTDDQAGELRANLAAVAQACPPVSSKIFGVAHWNAGGSSPSWVWSVGDNPEADEEDPGLDRLHYEATAALENMHSQPDGGFPPSQHSPWVAHICAAYTDDLTLAKELEKRNGPVTFDRIRLSLGEQDWDIPLTGGNVTAAANRAHLGEFRRALTAAETASRVDFTGHQQGWKTAVDGALADWSGIEAAWRNQIREQLSTDSAAHVDVLHVDTTAAQEVLYQRMLTVAQAAGRAQQRAAEQQGVTVPEWSLGEDASVTAAGGLSRLAQLRLVAKLTADVQASRLVDSAKRKTMSLINVFSGLRLASEVEAFLRTLSQAFAREGLGAAMTAAQAAGQQAVLEAAPTASSYYASEILDDRVCDPCRQIDGKEFSSLDDAEATYPGGCYADCLGGGRCRGQIVAVWDNGITAAAMEAGMTTAVEELGGKPNPGTKPDKRLKDNKDKMAADLEPCPTCPGDEHFHSGDVVELAWDGSESRFTDEQYKKAAAACDPGPGTVKELCVLPHHDPDGSLNRDGLAAAAGRVSALEGHPASTKSRAEAHLRAHYHQIGEDVPPNLAAAAGTQVLTVNCPPGWTVDPDSDGCLPPGYTPGSKVSCPEGWMSDDDGDGCVPMDQMTAAARQVVDAPSAAPADDSQTAPWNGVLAVEGVTTGDGREFAPGALTWRDLPVPLRWNRVDSHGGEARTEAVNVGRIDTIERVGNELRATGVFDLSTPDGKTAHSKVKGQMLRGVSIDADSISDPDIELVWPENPNEGEDEEADIFAMLFAQPEKVIFHGGRISAATLCDIPAFAEAYVALTDDSGAVTAGGAMDPAEWAAAQPEPEERPALIAHAAPFTPPSEWFTNPQLSLPTPITVDDQGRLYGHAAQWGTCHIGQSGQCVQPPRENEHPYFMTGELDTADAGAVSVGQITVGTGHAPLNAGPQAATEHYDHTGWAVADVAVGNDSHGIWVAGCIRADADPAKVAALRAAGQVSGDWRRIGGKLRLVGLLAVNVPGFPVPRMRARVAGGAQYALVAAGQPTVAPGIVSASGPSEGELDQQAMRRVMEMLSRRVKEI